MRPNPHNLCADEIQLFETLESGGYITFLTSTERKSKYEFVKAFLLEQLIKGKTFVLRVKNKELSNNILESLGLKHLSIVLKKDTQVKKEELANHETKDRAFHLEAIKSSITYRKTLERISLLKDKYTQPVFGEYPRKKLAELHYLAQKRKNHFSLDLDLSSKEYAYNQKEFWQIRGSVEKAAKYYKSAFTYLRSKDEFCDDVYKDFHLAENQEVVFKYLQKFISDSEELSKKYRATFEKIRDSLVSTYNNHISALSKLNNDFELQLEFYKIESEFAPAKKTFGRKSDAMEKQKIELRSLYSLLLDELNKGQLFKLKTPENNWIPDLDELFAVNIDIKNLLKNAHQLIQNKVDEQMEILNSNNYDAPELAIHRQEQGDILYAINGSKLFKKEIHNLSISTWQNYLFLKKLTKDLIKSKLFLECNMDYAIYRSYEFTLQKKVSSVICALENIKNSDWVETFEAWYFKALFNKYSTRDLLSISQQFEKLAQDKHLDASYQGFRVSCTFDKQQSEKSTFAKNLGKEGRDWKSLMLSSKKGFKSYFPIIICDEEFFTSELTNLEYDYLICIDNEEIPQNIFANSHFHSILCTFNSVLPPQVKQNASNAKNYKSKKLVNLKSKIIPTGHNVTNNLSEKISLSKAVTYVLGQSAYEKQFYSARNFSIITCLSPFCTKLLEMELLDIRIKSLRYTHLESGIVDDVILKEDDNKYLIIQDGFLDPQLDLEWQMNVLRRLQQAGLKLITIYSEELANNPKKRVLDLISIPEMKAKLEQLA